MTSFCYDPPAGYQFPEYLKRYLRNRGMPIRSLSDVPVQAIREAQIDLVYEEMQSVMLSSGVAEKMADLPVLNRMLVTRIGSCEYAKGHYIPRPEGTHEVVIHFCTKGRGWLRFSDQPDGLRDIGTGEAFLLPPGIPHAYGSSDDDPWSIVWIHAIGSLVSEFLELLRMRADQPVCRISDMRQVESLHARIFREMQKRHHPSQLVSASAKLYELFNYLLSEQQGGADSPAHAALQKSIDFMEERVHQNVTLEEMAQAAGLSLSRYSYLFKQAEGISPGEYFRQLRMQQAAQYLISNPLSISEVAQKSGYEDPYYFSRVFKQVMGKSPREYRKSFQE